jgi:hypothetical protein
MLNLILCLSIRKCSNKFMYITMWEYWTFDKCLDVVKFTTLIPLSLPIFCKLLFQIVGFKMSFFYLLWHWNLLTKFSHSILRIYWIHVLIPCRNSPSYNQESLTLLGHECSQQWLLIIMYDIPSETLTLSIAEMILLHTKNLSLIQRLSCGYTSCWQMDNNRTQEKPIMHAHPCKGQRWCVYS